MKRLFNTTGPYFPERHDRVGPLWVLLGLLVLLAAWPASSWSEGQALDHAKALAHGGTVVVSVPASVVWPANQGKLVHVSGLAEPVGQLIDPDFGLTLKAIHLRRKVEMFQWVEEARSPTQEKPGGGSETLTRYSYTKQWSGAWHDSSRFQQPQWHQNPAGMRIPSADYSARDVRLGAFRLNAMQIGRIGRAQPVSLAGHQLMPSYAGQPVWVQGNRLYVGHLTKDTRPSIGALRISFEAVGPTDISVVAQQQGDSFAPFMTDTGDVQWQAYGRVPAHMMLQREPLRNALTGSQNAP